MPGGENWRFFMFKNIAIIFLLVIGVFCAVSNAAQLSDDWSEFIHYAKIGRIELAKSYANKIIDSEPDPKELLEISKQNPAGYDLVLRMYAHSEELKDVAGQILDIIESGRYDKRTDAGIIAEEIRRLSSTSRGRLKAIERLKNSGEYAIPMMIDALSDPARKDEFANITSAMPKIGRDAIRPLATALQTENVAVKAEIINALSEIGYSQALPYLKYVIENDQTPQMQQLAASAMSKIDASAMQLSAAELFYLLGNDYYYKKESLMVRSGYDFGNIWFWDEQARQLRREEVPIESFYYLMSMRASEWALRGDAGIGKAIGLWIAAFFKVEQTDEPMPQYFGEKHADAMTYAQTAGPEYLHMALRRAIIDKDAYVALNSVESLAVNAGEKSLLYMIGTNQPLIEALSFDDKAVRYSAAIAIGQAGPTVKLPQTPLIIENLENALKAVENADFNDELAMEYSQRALTVMLKLLVEGNDVVDVMKARDAIIDSLNDPRNEMKMMAAEVLARLNSPEAQRAIADAAIDSNSDMAVRLEAFSSLAKSAKLFGNLLEDSHINMLYELIDDQNVDPKIRSAAAGAYGALNLPSDKVKVLILDQAKY